MNEMKLFNHFVIILEVDMKLNTVFERFVKGSPISVMARGIMERVLNHEQLDEWYDKTAEKQYTRDLLFHRSLIL